MYNIHNGYPLPYYPNTPMYSLNDIYRSNHHPYYFGMPVFNPNVSYRWGCSYPCYSNEPTYNTEYFDQFNTQYPNFFDSSEYYSRSNFVQDPEGTTQTNIIDLIDYGPEPFVVNIDDATEQNNNFRTALWTGSYLQLTLMSIEVGSEIGLENHPNTDQFIRVESGKGLVRMGDNENNLNFEERISDDFAIIIPAGKWHNIINTGSKPLKVYSIYAPPNHPHSIVNKTKADSETAEEQQHSFINSDTNIKRNYW